MAIRQAKVTVSFLPTIPTQTYPYSSYPRWRVGAQRAEGPFVWPHASPLPSLIQQAARGISSPLRRQGMEDTEKSSEEALGRAMPPWTVHPISVAPRWHQEGTGSVCAQTQGKDHSLPPWGQALPSSSAFLLTHLRQWQSHQVGFLAELLRFIEYLAASEFLSCWQEFMPSLNYLAWGQTPHGQASFLGFLRLAAPFRACSGLYPQMQGNALN